MWRIQSSSLTNSVLNSRQHSSSTAWIGSSKDMVTRSHTVLSILPVRVTHKVPIVRRPMDRDELMHNIASPLSPLPSSISLLPSFYLSSYLSLFSIFGLNPHASTVLLNPAPYPNPQWSARTMRFKMKPPSQST